MSNYLIKDYLSDKDRIYQNTTMNNKDYRLLVNNINTNEPVKQGGEGIPRFGIKGDQQEIRRTEMAVYQKVQIGEHYYKKRLQSGKENVSKPRRQFNLVK